jgi:hypothetical protein
MLAVTAQVPLAGLYNSQVARELAPPPPLTNTVPEPNKTATWSLRAMFMEPVLVYALTAQAFPAQKSRANAPQESLSLVVVFIVFTGFTDPLKESSAEVSEFVSAEGTLRLSS